MARGPQRSRGVRELDLEHQVQLRRQHLATAEDAHHGGAQQHVRVPVLVHCAGDAGVADFVETLHSLVAVVLSALQQVMHGHGAIVVVNVVAALTVGEDLDALDEAGWVWSGRRKWVGGVSVSDSEGDFDCLRIDKGGQEDSLLESQMQLGSLQYPHNPMKGASEHFHFLSILAGTYDDTVRNIDIGRVGYLRHSFIAGFPTERVPKMPLSGVSTGSVHFQGARRYDDGRVHPPDSLSAGDALRHRRLCARLTRGRDEFSTSDTGPVASEGVRTGTLCGRNRARRGVRSGKLFADTLVTKTYVKHV